jgi:hypothetical protein
VRVTGQSININVWSKGNSNSKNIKYAIINIHKLKLIHGLGERDFSIFAQATCQMENANYFWKKLMKRDTKNSVLLDKIK